MEFIFGFLGLIALLAGGGAFIWSFFWPKENQYGNSGKDAVELGGKNVARFGGLALIILFFILSSVKVIPAGSVGVVKHFGAIESGEKAPGINLVLPLVTDIVNVETRIQAITFDKLAAASREYQDVFLTGTLNVHVQNDRAAELYQQVGLDYADKIVKPFYANIVKEIVPQYGIAEILPKREEIRRLTVEKLSLKLNPYGIAVDDVALSNVDFNEQYNAAIQDKQVQELRVATERNILEQKKIQAEQVQVAAAGEAQAQIERAKGEAEANRLVSESLTENILINRYISLLNPNVQVMLVPQGQQFLLDLNSLRPAQ